MHMDRLASCTVQAASMSAGPSNGSLGPASCLPPNSEPQAGQHRQAHRGALLFCSGSDGRPKWSVVPTCSDPKLGNTDERIEAGDKVVKVSASFGDDVWEALNFGQVT